MFVGNYWVKDRILNVCLHACRISSLKFFRFGFCLRHPSSKVAVLKDWASFAEVHGRTQPGNRMKIIALASDHECARANERNIFSKPNLAAFMCRMAFAKRDLCGL